MKKLWQSRWFRPIVAFVLAVMMFLVPAGDAWARSGGRIGGGSFRSMPRSMPRSGPRYVPAPYSPGYGGGFGFPLVFPFFFGGGGGLFTLLLVLGVGSFLIRTVRGATQDEGGQISGSRRNVRLYEIRVGLLANARSLQKEIDRLAMEANTDTPEGLSRLLQDVCLSLVRHQDFWVYGQSSAEVLSLPQAEQVFYQRSLQERSNFSVETLSKIGSQSLQQTKGSQLSPQDSPGEYIVVTLLVASEAGGATLPVADSASALRQGLTQLASTSAEKLVAMEVLWTPQQEGDILTTDEMLAEYPQLRLL